MYKIQVILICRPERKQVEHFIQLILAIAHRLPNE